eukprot:1991008-Rhodomonas_salina.2
MALSAAEISLKLVDNDEKRELFFLAGALQPLCKLLIDPKAAAQVPRLPFMAMLLRLMVVLLPFMAILLPVMVVFLPFMAVPLVLVVLLSSAGTMMPCMAAVLPFAVAVLLFMGAVRSVWSQLSRIWWTRRNPKP